MSGTNLIATLVDRYPNICSSIESKPDICDKNEKYSNEMSTADKMIMATKNDSKLAKLTTIIYRLVLKEIFLISPTYR